MREENEKIMDGGFIMGRDEERTVELVVESIIVEDNPKSFDAQVKAFYNTYVDVKVIGYDTQLMGRVVLQITTLMGTKINTKAF